LFNVRKKNAFNKRKSVSPLHY